ncbi:MAG: exodeoxyribonuclease VII large subunit [Tidjanibacter sp.]|nr:exodeoxyribonuclease VII large subunit [Tidjanibacter sp.]
MTTEKHITLSDLLDSVKRTLAEQFPLGVWISAEIGELKVNNYSGHCYMELIEKSERDGTPKAKASAAIWRNRWGMLSAHFRAATGSDLTAGMSVLLKVSLSFHEAYGLTLVVNDIDPTYTLGEGERRKRETIAALEADGTINLNHELPFPTVIERIAVISSATAAGLQDFRRHIAESTYRIEIELFEAIVQGALAEESIVEALGQIAACEEKFDAVAIIRGGGSQSDMECFNSYTLASHIAQFPLPVVTGIGHDKDSSVVDIVAARSLKTPTAVADFLVALAEGVMTEAESLWERIGVAANHLLTSHSARLAHSSAKLLGGCTSLLGAMNSGLQRAEVGLRHATERLFESHRSRLAVAESATRASSPERLLAMGFAVVRSGGKVVRDASMLSEGDRVELTLVGGTKNAVITNKE